MREDETLEETFGRYRLLERLGEGGMAEVFKAKSFGVEGFEKVLVIKRILPKLAEHAKFVDMFVHEAKLAVRLSHANIVQVFDLGRIDHPTGEPPSYFIAMEFVPGLDLATLVSWLRKTKTQVPLGMAVFITAEVAKGLDHAHRRRGEQGRSLGIVHRDVSPQNILLSWEGEVKVTDFGIAKAKDTIDEDELSEARTGKIRGKLAYMSPEQTRSEPLDGRSDLFSLGTVLYEMIAGQNPFIAPTAAETLRRLQSSEYPPIELCRPDATTALIDIVAKMLQKSPEDRFPDAGRLHEQLLGYFYASGDRFSANDLADFLAPLNERHSVPEIEAGVVFENEQTGSNDRTPVEIPHATGRPPTGAISLTDSPDSGQVAWTAERGERRDVTALVLAFLERSAAGSRGPADTITTSPGPAEERESRPGPPAEEDDPAHATARTPSEPAEAQERSPAAIVRARDVLARYGARVLEEEPSQIVAIFGLGDADGRDTEAAVRSALVTLRARTGSASVSAGIHVARILVDGTGNPIQDERLASLIAVSQSLARATDGRVAVSPLAGRIIRTAFATEDLPGAGRTAPEGGRIVSSARPPAAVYGRFVGRQDELMRLGDILAHATRKRAQIVTIHGDKGIGKTRLLAEVERRLWKGNYNVGFYVASCPQNGADVPWSGLTAMLQVLCGIQEGDDEERILDVLPRLRALGLHDDESTAVLGQLGASLAHSHPRPTGDTSGALRNAFTRMVQRLTDDRIHCFAWDDAQAIDPATVEAILATVGRATAPTEGAPPRQVTPGGLSAMFLLATRDEPPPTLAAHPAHHVIALTELSGEESARLISTRVGARVLPPDFLAFCRERAGGHPLFLEELVKELTDSGAISVLNGAVKASVDGTTTIPRTLRTLIAARVSRLDANRRGVLQAAAILGDPVLTAVLAAMLRQNLTQIDRAVAELVTEDLLRITGPAQASFASPMHGEIVLDAIPPQARRELHADAAAAYIAVVGEDSTEHAERIAQHLYQAGDRDHAATFFAREALHRIRVGQLEPAIRHLTRALDLADLAERDSQEIAAWLRALGDVVTRVRSAPDLPDLAARALRRVDAAGTLEERVCARVDVARALGSVNLFEDAYTKLENAFSLASDRDDLRQRALIAELEMAVRSGDFTRAAQATEKIEAIGTITDPRVFLAIAQARAAAGDSAAALAALDQAERLGNPDDLVAASEREKQRVLVYLYIRDFKRAVESSTRAVEISRSAGLRYETAAALHNLGDASRRIGDLPRAYASFSESRDMGEAAGHERLTSLNRMNLAYLDGMGGVLRADAMLKEFIRYADARGYWTDALESRFLLAALQKHRGDRVEAKRELEQVLTMATAYGNKLIAHDAREALEDL